MGSGEILTLPRVNMFITSGRRFFAHHCDLNLSLPLSILAFALIFPPLGEFTPFASAPEMRHCSLQALQEGRREGHWFPALGTVCQGREIHSRDQKTSPGIYIYLSSSPFHLHCTRLYLPALKGGREKCAGVTPSRWLLGCQGCCLGELTQIIFPFCLTFFLHSV